MYKIFTRRQKETVSYINYIINKGVVLYPGNSLQTMHSSGGLGVITTETASGTGQMSQRSFPFIFLVKPLKAMTENSTVEEMPITNVILRERGEGWVSGPYIRPLVGPPMGPRSDPLFM